MGYPYPDFEHLLVRHEPLSLPSPSTLAAGDPLAGNWLVKPRIPL